MLEWTSIPELEQERYLAGRTHVAIVKQAGDAARTNLTGRLYFSKSGWLLLSVPNSLGRGAFDALNEPGLELPLQSSGMYNAHVTVMSPDEISKIGGPDKITERGHEFDYTLGPVKTVVPDGWNDVSRVWYISVDSPALRTLRKSYGLEPLRKGYEHHVTIAVRRKNIPFENTMSKVSELVNLLEPPSMLDALRQAKALSDRHHYLAKHALLNTLMRKAPDEFIRDSEANGIVGITHTPTNFRIHVPAHAVPGAVA